MRKLFLIPARGGSKGLPRKNILPLAGRPMIYYTLDAALGAMESGDEVCVSTDDLEIIEKVQDYGLSVPFIRPAELASDIASTEDVIRHAIDWYIARELNFDIVILLQPTSPLRKSTHIKDAISIYNESIDMVVSVKETDSNPYYVLFEEDKNGWLHNCKSGNFTRRQDCPKVYEYNGGIYVFGTKNFLSRGFSQTKKIKKLLMSKKDSIDIDDFLDFKYAETILKLYE